WRGVLWFIALILAHHGLGRTNEPKSGGAVGVGRVGNCFESGLCSLTLEPVRANRPYTVYASIFTGVIDSKGSIVVCLFLSDVESQAEMIVESISEVIKRLVPFLVV